MSAPHRTKPPGTIIRAQTCLSISSSHTHTHPPHHGQGLSRHKKGAAHPQPQTHTRSHLLQEPLCTRKDKSTPERTARIPKATHPTASQRKGRIHRQSTQRQVRAAHHQQNNLLTHRGRGCIGYGAKHGRAIDTAIDKYISTGKLPKRVDPCAITVLRTLKGAGIKPVASQVHATDSRGKVATAIDLLCVGVFKCNCACTRSCA